MDSIMELITGDDMASKMGVISVAVAGAVVAATALVMRSSRKRKAEEEEKNKESQGKLGSALEELTQKERERRKRLEEEVFQTPIITRLLCLYSSAFPGGVHQVEMRLPFALAMVRHPGTSLQSPNAHQRHARHILLVPHSLSPLEPHPWPLLPRV